MTSKVVADVINKEGQQILQYSFNTKQHQSIWQHQVVFFQNIGTPTNSAESNNIPSTQRNTTQHPAVFIQHKAKPANSIKSMQNNTSQIGSIKSSNQ